MATDIQLNTKIDTANSAQSLGEIRRSLRDLIALQSQVGAGSAEFTRLSNAINETEDRMGNLQDGFNTLRGSGVERLNSSLGLLRQGFSNADPGQIGTAFRGLGAAMSAVPIFLLVEGFKALIENWDKVIAFGKSLFDIFSEDERAVKKLTAEYEKQSAITKEVTGELKREVEQMEASGVSHTLILAKKKELIASQIQEANVTAKLNLAKLQEARNNDTITESLYKVQAALLRKIGQEEAAEKLDIIIAASKIERTKAEKEEVEKQIELIKDLKNTEKVDELKNNKELSDSFKKSQDDKRSEAEKLAASDAKRRQEQNAQEELEVAALDKSKIDSEKKVQEARDSGEALSFDFRTEIGVKKDAQDAEELKKAKDLALAKANVEFEIAKSGIQSLQGLSDLAFSIKSANEQKGTSEAEKSARAQFKINKGLQIANAGISGAQGVLQAVTAPSGVPIPFDIPFRVAKTIGIIATTGATISKIAGTQFNSGAGSLTAPSISGGSGSSGSGSIGSIPPPPKGNLTPFAFDKRTVGNIGEPGGKNTPSNNQNTSNPSVVSVVEIVNVMKKVNATESQARFG